jgi:hypothetical protein
MSSSSTPSDPNTLYLSFTSLLYAAVIDAALHHLDDLSLSRKNILLVVALLIVVQDYFFYFLDIVVMPKEEREKKPYIFWLDILVLGSWYALSLAVSLPSRDFMFYLVIFFTAVTIWELTASIKRTELAGWNWVARFFWTPVPISLLAIVLYIFLIRGYIPSKVINVQNGSGVSEISLDDVCLGLLLFVFLVWRILYYYLHMRGKVTKVLQEKKKNEDEDARFWTRVKEFIAQASGG